MDGRRPPFGCANWGMAHGGPSLAEDRGLQAGASNLFERLGVGGLCGVDVPERRPVGRSTINHGAEAGLLVVRRAAGRESPGSMEKMDIANMVEVVGTDCGGRDLPLFFVEGIPSLEF